ncbi:MAG: WD40 repeat domain-containing protein [Oscillospiraceae bacterium]|nr:WD40 repeat domain-containing protein [Oscillospiraceae bacterium]
MSAFSVFSDRKKRKKNTQTPTVEQYYENRARRLSHVRYTCLLLTVLFVVYGFAVHGEELTPENFRYMLKFVDLTEEDDSTEANTVHFDYASGNIGGIYKGDVAVLNGDGLSLYGWDAEKLFSVSFRMESPRLAIAPQSIFAYDLGGSEVRIFNSYSQYAQLTLSYPIYGFSTCDTGAFAVITSEKNYRTAIYVYDSNARQVYKRMLSDTYIDQIALSPDGSEFLALGHYAQGGDLITVLQRYTLTDEEPVFTATFSGELPLRVDYLTDQRFAVLTGGALRCYQVGTEEPVGTLSLGEASLQGCSFSGGRVLLTFSDNSLSGGTVLRVYGDDAALQASYRYEGTVNDKMILQGSLCVLTMGEVTVTPLSGGEPTVYEIGKDALQLLSDGETLVLFEKSDAYRLSERENA